MRRERHEGVEDMEKVFWKEAKVGLKKNWILLIYLCPNEWLASSLWNPISLTPS